MDTPLNLAWVQLEVQTGDLEANLAQAEAAIAAAAQAGAHGVVLPELWATGYAWERAAHLADPLESGVFERMSGWAQRYGVAVGGSHLERDADGLYNTFALYGPDGARWLTYRKVHLFGPLEEPQHLRPGQAPGYAETPWGPLGVAICYDLRFPELFRTLALLGARLLLVVAAWPTPRLAHWEALLRARAIENQVTVLGVNRVGADRYARYGGHSRAYAPEGRLLGGGDAAPGWGLVSLPWPHAAGPVAAFSPLRDRRPEVYGAG